MNPYFTEVIDAHIAIERWLGKGPEKSRRCWRALRRISA